jgi:hypothetical protein
VKVEINRIVFNGASVTYHTNNCRWQFLYENELDTRVRSCSLRSKGSNRRMWLSKHASACMLPQLLHYLLPAAGQTPLLLL